MIQRIQSIFLLLAGLSAFGVFAFPFASTPAAVGASRLFADAQYTTGDSPALAVLFGLAGLLALAAIFQFRKRQTQAAITRFALVFALIGLVFAVWYYYNDSGNLGSSVPADGVAAYLPIVSVLMSGLALRFIQKDDKLVRSMDRLR